MFAINRIDKVIGRIIFLVNSIKTRAGVKVIGDPSGTRWVRNLFNLLYKEYIIILSHIVKPIGNTIVIWEFIVNKVGIIEIKFKIKIKMNNGVKNDAVKFLADNVLISV